MTPLDPPSPPLCLLDLPTEIHVAIYTQLHVLDRHSLRLTNRYFNCLIPPPEHLELIRAETPGFDYLACVGCMRLRPKARFSDKMVKKKKAPGGEEAWSRFCIECGRRPLPGLHRYTRGARWRENGVPFARCLQCQRIAVGPEDQAVKLCLTCHMRPLERARAAEEQERKALRLERRRIRIESGWAAPSDSDSDYYERDLSEQDDGVYFDVYGDDFK